MLLKITVQESACGMVHKVYVPAVSGKPPTFRSLVVVNVVASLAPVREAFEVPPNYKLLCGLALGWPSGHVVNAYNPGRAEVAEMLIPEKRG